MKTVFLIAFVLIALAPIAAAETCSYDEAKILSLEGKTVKELPGAKFMLGNHGTFELTVTDTDKVYTFAVIDGVLASYDGDVYKYTATTDSCTIKALQDGDLELQQARKEGKLELHANGWGAHAKLVLASIGLGIAHLFGKA